MYVAIYPMKDGRPVRGFPKTILCGMTYAGLGVKLAIEIPRMMDEYKQHGVKYDIIAVEPTKKPNEHDRRMFNVPIPA